MSTGTAILYSVHVKLKTQINSRKKKERFPFTVEVVLTQKKKNRRPSRNNRTNTKTDLG